MTTMPRVLSDVARIEEVLKNIEEEMQSLAAQLRTFDQRNVAGVEDLSRLDTLKNNMEQVIYRPFYRLHLPLQMTDRIISVCLGTVQGDPRGTCSMESSSQGSEELSREWRPSRRFC